MRSGERGIRTPGTSRYDGFQDRCNRPLYHLSFTIACAMALWSKRGANVELLMDMAKRFVIFFLKSNNGHFDLWKTRLQVRFLNSGFFVRNFFCIFDNKSVKDRFNII